MIIAGNWKMNKTITEAKVLVSELKEELNGAEAEVVFCPSTLVVSSVKEELKGTDIKIGAQNMYFEESGAFTGETSPLMLKDLGVNYVILGHSERRNIFGESNELINKKVVKAFETEITPILCVGESLEVRKSGKEVSFVSEQIEKCLVEVKDEQVKNMVIAYEPIWAIGTGETATSEQAEDMCKEIRNLIEKLYNTDTASTVRIQYGGSVKPANAKEILSMPNIDGALVGGAALKKDFIDIVKAI
jgi:triosephosphate isomerase